MMSELSFGEWLQRRRRSLGLTQEQLAIRINCSISAVRKFEREERRPSEQIVEQFVEVFNIPLKDRTSFLKFARGSLLVDALELIEDAPWQNSTLYTRSNLPTPINTFIGREKEIAEISQTINEHRLLTLTGVGGTGKTRLSLQVSTNLIDEFPDGVWFVQLAPISDATLVPQAVASVWGVRDQPDQSLSKLLSDFARSKNLLLVLDNCEHLIEICARLIENLLRNAPMIKILATSRVHLNIDGEMIYPVNPLALPDPDRQLPLPTLTQYEAVRLFIDRAILARPSFSVNNENAPTIAQICQQLDGIPLAIELAAARIRALSPNQIASRLDDRFDLLTRGKRNALPRQQTLQATMDWSYELLSEYERLMLNQISVFAGNFSLKAAEAIFSDKIADNVKEIQDYLPKPIDLITALVDNSLVGVKEWGIDTRYTLLDTVRYYALEKLDASGEMQSVKNRHLEFYLKLAEEGFPYVWVGQTEWMDRFEIEYDNFRIAMEHAISVNLESAIRLGKSLDMFWDLTRRQKESYQWAMRILESSEIWEPGKWRALALGLAGTRTSANGNREKALNFLETGLEMARQFGSKQDLIYLLQGLAAINWFASNFEKMRIYATEYLDLSQELSDAKNISGALWQLGAAACEIGDLELGCSYYEQSIELGRKEDAHLTITSALRELAIIAHRKGELARAKSLYQECIEESKSARWVSHTVGLINRLGQIALQEKNTALAKTMFNESLARWRAMRVPEGNADILTGFFGVAACGGQYKFAAKLLGASEAAYQNSNFRLDDVEHSVYDPIMAKVREELEESIFAVEWNAGSKMSVDEATEYAIDNLH